MNLHNLKIGQQLRLGLGVILLLVVLLSAMAWKQTGSLWQETKGLYEHPLAVRCALGELNADVLTMRQEMLALCLAGNDQERQLILQKIDTSEADARRQFEVLYDRYLGPRSDIDQAFQAFVQWKALREETLRLLQAGKVVEAVSRTKSTGVCGVHVEKVMKEINDVSVFANNRANQFFADAQKHRDGMSTELGLVFVTVLLAAWGIFYFLLRGIKDPLKELTSVTDQYREGRLDVRSQYAGNNELGELAASFNGLAEAVEREIVIKENTARLAEVMIGEESLRSFCRELLKAMMEHTKSQVGAVYLLNEQKTTFEHFESMGLTAGSHRATFSASENEGEFGLALATRKIQRVTDIPSDTRLTFSLVSGEAVPREIITIPILTNEHVVAVISLASVRNYSALAIRLIDEIWHLVSARMNGVLVFQQLCTFSEKLELQNQALEAQKKELAIQSDELTEHNIELEMQKQQLDEASRLKSSFLSNMSHELRTPLNSVIALSGVLGRRLAKTIPAEEHSYLDVIERNGQHLISLINDILDLSRIESGRTEISLCRFSLHELVDEVVRMIEPQSREKGIALMNHVTEDIPFLTSDRAQCRHILQNLIGNAVKFTEEGTVEISARQAGDEMHLVVSDTGIGIAADNLPIIFEEFRQADDTTSRKYGGSGLGLAIAKKCAELLHGNITVKSTLGKGSAFTLQLPVVLNVPTAAEVEGYSAMGVAPTAQAPLPNGLGKSILLVEDSEPAIIQMKDILTQHGYSIRVAHNGKEALEEIARNAPDAMILDLMMPEVDGFQVLKTIRGEENPRILPTLILTAKHVTREELDFLKGNHVHQLIQKGNVSKDELLAAVGGMLAPHLEKPVPTPRKAPRKPISGKPVILVVEDHPDNMKTARALLQDICTLLEAMDGQAAIEQARLHKPDLIMMDLALPVMDGFRTLDAIRKDETLCHIPVIAVTASAMKGNREEILAHGFDAYIAKPIDADLLHKTLWEVLHGEP